MTTYEWQSRTSSCDIRLDHYHGVGDDSECESDFSLGKKGTQEAVLKDFTLTNLHLFVDPQILAKRKISFFIHFFYASLDPKKAHVTLTSYLHALLKPINQYHCLHNNFQPSLNTFSPRTSMSEYFQTAGSSSPAPPIPYISRRSPYYARSYMACTSQTLATSVATKILQKVSAKLFVDSSKRS